MPRQNLLLEICILGSALQPQRFDNSLLALDLFNPQWIFPFDISYKYIFKQDNSGIPATLLHLNQIKDSSPNGDKSENEEQISDTDLDNIVGVGDSSELEVTRLCLLFNWIGSYV